MKAFRAACVKAADDHDGGAISGDDIGAAVIERWHAENRIKPLDAQD